MTLQEASSCFHLDVKMLQLYEESGLIRTEKTESGEPDYRRRSCERRPSCVRCSGREWSWRSSKSFATCSAAAAAKRRSACCANAAAGCWNRSTKSSRRWTGWTTSFTG